MSEIKISKEELIKRYQAGERETLVALAGVKNMSSLGRKMRDVYGIKVVKEPKPAPEPVPEPPTVDETINSDLRFQKANTDSNHYKKLYSQAIKDLSMQQVIADTLENLAKTIPPLTVSTPQVALVRHTDRGSETDCLHLGDIHGGEVVSREETMGLGHYNMQITSRRLGMLFAKTIEIVELRRSSLNIPNLTIAEGGDMVSGNIHEELSRTNADMMMNLTIRIAFMVAQGIAQLSPYFEQINIECEPGNHGRLTLKPAHKQRYHNWDYLCYQLQAILCRDLHNVTFHIPKSPFHIFTVENTRVLMIHGEGVKSWAGIPYYGIDRARARFREMLQTIDKQFDCMFIYHFHRGLMQDIATGFQIINGSVIGTNEFSANAMQASSRPYQILSHWHSKNGYIGSAPLYLDSADDKSKYELNDALPDVWADFGDLTNGK